MMIFESKRNTLSASRGYNKLDILIKSSSDLSKDAKRSLDHYMLASGRQS